ncbi:hypothetical protein U1Q18_041715 [Sarracenia purpurea var. burkii]
MVNPILFMEKTWRNYAQGLEVGPATKEPSDEKAPLDSVETELEVKLTTPNQPSLQVKGQGLNGDTKTDLIGSRQSMKEEAVAHKILNSGEESDQPAIESSKQDGLEYEKFSTIKVEITEDAIGPMVSKNASVDQLASKSISTSPVSNLR